MCASHDLPAMTRSMTARRSRNNFARFVEAGFNRPVRFNSDVDVKGVLRFKGFRRSIVYPS